MPGVLQAHQFGCAALLVDQSAYVRPWRAAGVGQLPAADAAVAAVATLATTLATAATALTAAAAVATSEPDPAICLRVGGYASPMGPVP